MCGVVKAMATMAHRDQSVMPVAMGFREKRGPTEHSNKVP